MLRQHAEQLVVDRPQVYGLVPVRRQARVQRAVAADLSTGQRDVPASHISVSTAHLADNASQALPGSPTRPTPVGPLRSGRNIVRIQATRFVDDRRRWTVCYDGGGGRMPTPSAYRAAGQCDVLLVRGGEEVEHLLKAMVHLLWASWVCAVVDFSGRQPRRKGRKKTRCGRRVAAAFAAAFAVCCLLWCPWIQHAGVPYLSSLTLSDALTLHPRPISTDSSDTGETQFAIVRPPTPFCFFNLRLRVSTWWCIFL